MRLGAVPGWLALDAEFPLATTGHRPGPLLRLPETLGSRSRCDAGWAGAAVLVAGTVPAKTLSIIAQWRDHGELMGGNRNQE